MSTIASPTPGPPQVFSTADGSIQGLIDGINTVFTTGVYLKQAFVWKNGRAQTNGADVSVVGAYLVFLPGAVPLQGDIITMAGYVGP